MEYIKNERKNSVPVIGINDGNKLGVEKTVKIDGSGIFIPFHLNNWKRRHLSWVTQLGQIQFSDGVSLGYKIV